MKILIASPIRQNPEILRRFLESLNRLEKPCQCDYYFLTQLDPLTTMELEHWAYAKPVKVDKVNTLLNYVTDETTHNWNSALVDWVMGLRNDCITKAINGEYDYLFMVDSDTVLHPKTLIQLLSRQKDIIGEISWTRWYPHEREYPNAWFTHNYSFPLDGLKRLKEEELLEVAGFGGLALISQKALQAGVNYSRIPEIDPEWGEDRHFAVRAKKLGFKLWIDTLCPSIHIYRQSDLKRLDMQSVYMAIPNTGQIESSTVAHLLQICRQAERDDINLLVVLPEGMPVDSNRNNIIKNFLSTNNEWLFMLDSDITPPIGVLKGLLSHGKPIVGAICFSSMPGEKGTEWEQYSLPYPVCMERAPEGGWRVARTALGSGESLVEVDAIGAACVLIHREVLEAMSPPWFKLGYDEFGVCNLGEDFGWCLRAKGLGYKIFVDTSLKCEHTKKLGLKQTNELLAKVDNGGQST